MTERDELRKQTHPLEFEDWLELVDSIKGGNGDGKRKQAKPAITAAKRDTLTSLEVEQCGGFCVIWHDGPNLAAINETFKSVLRNGLKEDCGYLTNDGEKRYIQVCPQGLKITNTALSKQPLKEYQRILQQYVDSTNKARAGNPYILVWGSPVEGDTPRKTKITTFLAGDLVKAPALDDPCFMFATSENTRRTREFQQTLSKAVKHRNAVLTARFETVKYNGAAPPHELQHKLQSSLVTLIWIDQAVSLSEVISLCVFTPQERLFVICEGQDPQSRKTSLDLTRFFKLPEQQHIELGLSNESDERQLSQLADSVVDALQRTIDRTQTQKEMRQIWEQTKNNVEKILSDPIIDKEVVSSAVIKPFGTRVRSLANGVIVSGSDAKEDFVRIATPLYSKAERIYAINTDLFAGFWSVFDNETENRFLKKCPTVRLFLYSNAQSFFRNLDALNAQESHYHAENGSNAKLLVGDFDLYQQAFGNVNEDVAFIKIDDNGWYRFVLSNIKFEAKQLSEDAAMRDPQYVRLKNLGEIESGHMRRIPSELPTASNFEYLCWRRGFEKDSHFQVYITDVFKQNHRSGAHRVISFQNDGPLETQIPPKEFKKIVLFVHTAMSERLSDFQSEFGLRSVDYGSQMIRKIDKGSNERSNFPDNARHIVILHFETEDGLKKFSQSSEVKEIRRQLYRLILTAIGKPPGESELDYITEVMRQSGTRYVTTHDYSDRYELTEMFNQLEARGNPTAR